jgi:hypothetical protein
MSPQTRIEVRRKTQSSQPAGNDAREGAGDGGDDVGGACKLPRQNCIALLLMEAHEDVSGHDDSVKDHGTEFVMELEPG